MNEYEREQLRLHDQYSLGYITWCDLLAALEKLKRLAPPQGDPK